MSWRWVVFVAALVGSALVAAGFAVGVEDLTSARPPPPHLRTVSDAALARAGYTLTAVRVPPQCGVAQEVATRGWLPQGSVGCPIGRQSAIADATRGSGSRALEAVLAGVHSASSSQVAWLVLVQSSIVMTPAIACSAGTVATSARCPVPIGGTTLQMLDAYSGRVLRFLVVGPSGVLGTV